MFLPDFQIRKLCDNNHINRYWSPSNGPDTGKQLPIENSGPLITPFNNEYLGPVSYDIRLSHNFASPELIQAYISHTIDDIDDMLPSKVPLVNSKEIIGDNVIENRSDEIVITLKPHQVILCHSYEYFRIPPNMIGLLAMRSSFARQWLDHSTANLITAGFQGQITFELRNNSPEPFTLRSDMRPIQIMFSLLTGVPENPYQGVYQRQEKQLFNIT
jgi:deoxycytidine triphosphate deaminase